MRKSRLGTTKTCAKENNKHNYYVIGFNINLDLDNLPGSGKVNSLKGHSPDLMCLGTVTVVYNINL